MRSGRNPELDWGDMRLYRTNAKTGAWGKMRSRWGIPLQSLWGLRSTTGAAQGHAGLPCACWCTRRQRQPAAGAECRARIGKTTVQRLTDASAQLGLPAWRWSAIRSPASRQAAPPKGTVAVQRELIGITASPHPDAPPRKLGNGMEQSGYLAELITEGTDEAKERRGNCRAVKSALQYQGKTGGSLEASPSAALATDARQQDHRGQPGQP